MTYQTKSLSSESRALLEEAARRRLTIPSLLALDNDLSLKFPEWLQAVTPYWVWDWLWQVHVQAQLERLTLGEIDKLLLLVPPQHGKSSLVTERYSVYRIWRDPALRVGIGSYNQEFANRFGRRTRRIAVASGVRITSERSAANEWETPEDGGIVSVGVGSGVTGRPLDLLVIDDPVKSREEAESPAYRDRVWEWYTDDLYTRLQRNMGIVLIMTHWHMDDLAGRILASEDAPNWTVVRLPAEAEENDPLGREPGEPLCPERFDKAALEERKLVLGPYGYSALYQQRPTPRSGGMFHREWFEIVNAAPADVHRRVRYWDMAGTKGGGDWTAGLLLARTRQGSFYVEDVRRIQGSPAEVEQLIVQTAVLDGPETQVWMEQEPGASGKTVIAYYARVLAGYSFHGNPATGDKALRADPVASQAEVGNVKLVRGAWIAAFLDELALFNKGPHDDQVDGLSGAFMVLANVSGPPTIIDLDLLPKEKPEGEEEEPEPDPMDERYW